MQQLKLLMTVHRAVLQSNTWGALANGWDTLSVKLHTSYNPEWNPQGRHVNLTLVR